MKEGWEYKKLGEVCQKVTSIRWKDIPSDVYYPYIDLSAVDRDSLNIVETIEVNKKNAPSRAKQIVRTNDILFGTTRPTLRRVCLINEDYDESICSTGFCVLRAIEEYSLPKWLFYHLLSNRFYSYIEPLQSGANYPAVSDGIVRSYSIPIPPLTEQQRIVEELDLLSSIIEKKKEQLKELDNLAQSIFYDMFGEEKAIKCNWEKCRVGDIYKFQYGKGNNIPEDKGEYPCYGSNGVVGHHITFNSEDAPIIGHIGAYAGIVNWGKGKHYVTYNGVICKLIDDGNNPIYGYYMLKSQDYLTMAKRGGAQPFVSYDLLEEPITYIPPHDLQNVFAEKIEAIEKQKELIKQSIKEVETLFNSRMDYYFS